MTILESNPTEGGWRSPTACEIADTVWSIHRSYRLVCGMAAEGVMRLCGRQLQRPDDRREEERAAVCIPVVLTPVVVEGDFLTIAGLGIAGVTRDLSGHGVGLRHDQPIPTRFGIAEFDVFGDPVLLLMEMRWTCETHPLAFHSGARFIAVVDQRQFRDAAPPELQSSPNVDLRLSR